MQIYSDIKIENWLLLKLRRNKFMKKVKKKELSLLDSLINKNQFNFYTNNF